MKKALRISLLLLLMAGTALAMPNNEQYTPPAPTPLDNGGPDAYGYTWVDNDGGGGPTYNWIDITSIGTRVTGLADDNNVGPFSMGFQYPYYWYMVDHMWIGSNGYISFSSNANFAHPFAGIPTAGNPNDLVAVLVGDLDFTRGNGSCYYYSNAADTFIISWITVGEFGYIDSTHTFQVIFSASDTSILFQYGDNHGRFLDSGGTTRSVIGIENVNGQVGLEYLHDNLPSNHMWHSGLAMRFHPNPDPNFVVHDFGIVDGFVDGSGALYIPVNSTVTPRGLFKNFGNQAENNLPVRCVIRRGTTQVYTRTDTIAHLDPAEQTWVDFGLNFTPDSVTVYRVTFSTLMSGDQNNTNNTKTTELDSYRLPQEIAYCDNTPGATPRSWSGDFSGFGVEFQVPQDIRVTRGSFSVVAGTNGPAYIWILPDSAGHPQESNSLAGDTVTITTSGWVDIDFTADNLIFPANAKFYMVVLHAFQNTFSFDMDDTAPLSNRGWEYTGGLAPDRDRGVADIMFKVYADTATSVGVDDDDVIPNAFSLAQNYPNPFNARTIINFSLKNESDVSISIYNIAGQLVDVLSGHYTAGSNSMIWDASKSASGVYFYRLNVGDAAETRKMVLVK